MRIYENGHFFFADALFRIRTNHSLYGWAIPFCERTILCTNGPFPRTDGPFRFADTLFRVRTDHSPVRTDHSVLRTQHSLYERSISCTDGLFFVRTAHSVHERRIQHTHVVFFAVAGHSATNLSVVARNLMGRANIHPTRTQARQRSNC